jgi:hypothetical protein
MMLIEPAEMPIMRRYLSRKYVTLFVVGLDVALLVHGTLEFLVKIKGYMQQRCVQRSPCSPSCMIRRAS